jgi:octaprenyl-diphosphate synthase
VSTLPLPVEHARRVDLPVDPRPAPLRSTAAGQDPLELIDKLEVIRQEMADDIAVIESLLTGIAHGRSVAHQSARHLLAAEGKRLRPMCVALASRIGTGFGENARKVAAAVELVHNATLLHDDVVDLGELRRGTPTARMIWGNAASIYGGDLLLVEALELIRETGLVDLIDHVLSVIRQMVVAEALQLGRRGKVDADEATYFAVIEGKTAALFRAALFSGARAGGVDEQVARALEAYGQDLGLAFQIVDDVLDIAGDPAVTGKALFTDLREGKMTYPLLLALARDPALRPLLEGIAANLDAPVDTETARAVQRSVQQTHAVEDSLARARAYAESAVARLDAVPACWAKEALETVAWASLARSK